uniref:glycosyl hydrolase family 8 n=1 Tax=Chitinivorax sp. B TaxID=2502235 RepID=UPI0010F736E6
MPTLRPIAIALAIALNSPSLLSAAQAMDMSTTVEEARYASGVIRPNHVSQSQLEQATVAFYQSWKSRYLKPRPKFNDQYYVYYGGEDGKYNVSEGQGFGMLVTMQMAGKDAEARRYFDGLTRLYRAFPSSTDKGLMAWVQTIDNNGNMVNLSRLGSSAATDGDMDAAFALLLADKTWGSNGAINYKAEALKTLAALKRSIVHKQNKFLKVGDWAEDGNEPMGRLTRFSDYMFNHLRAFYQATGDAFWRDVLDLAYSIALQVQHDYSANTGLLPDFALRQSNGRFAPPPGKVLEADTDNKYAWNACRIPLRFAMDYLLTGDARALPILNTLNNWIRSNSGERADHVMAGYDLSGKPLANYSSLAFSAPFAVSAMVSNNNQAWLNKLWDHISKTDDKSYYADSIKMLSMIAVSGLWRGIEGNPTPTPTP